MSIIQITSETLTRDLGKEVPEIYVVIAKHSILGLDTHALAEMLGVPLVEVQEVEADPTYVEIRLILAAAHAQATADVDFSWDSLEQIALKNLHQRLPFERDGDFNLKVAAMANRAQRKHIPNQQRVLDPQSGGTRVALQLTSRIVQKFSGGQQQITEEIREVSVTNGTAQNPTFEDIDSLLGVSARPRIPEKMSIHTRGPEFSIDDLADDMEGFRNAR